ncbi:TonB-dependent receptor [Sphingobium aromaticiconvertens]|uniref:TonB-dependent receptor n=1 Tax=Sphingobium aromaticiconvertens TaxID=365341 RepID=UPI00301AFC8A
MKRDIQAYRQGKTPGLLSLALALGAANSAFAQEPTRAAPQAEASSEDIIVNARRRDERLQDVPLAVTAVSAEKLRSANITSVSQLSQVAPALVTVPSQGGGRSQPNFSIRGLSQQEISILGDQSVSTYVGDMVIARVQGINSALFDIGSVEVLRGPQGTLFGRNTTGGAVIIRPNKPTNKLEGMASVTLGRFDTFNTEAMLNIPLGEEVAFRIAGTTLKNDGYVYDELLGRNVDGIDQQAVRASLLINMAGGAESLTTYEYFHENDGSSGIFLKHANPNGSFNEAAYRAARGFRPIENLLAEQQARGIYRIAAGTPVFNRIETHSVSNTLTVPVSDTITIKNVIGWRGVKDAFRDDLDGTESSLFPQERSDRSNQFSNEFQVIGSFNRFDWIAGLYYFREHGRLQAESYAGAVDPGAIEPEHVVDYPGPSYSVTDVEGRNISYAAFAQGSYEILDGLKFTAGLRYSKDKRKAVIRNRLRSGCRFTIDDDGNPGTPEILPPLSGCIVSSSASFSEPTYNLSLDYEIAPSKLIYIAHRHGYRSGGFGSRASTQAGFARTFSPETVDDIELGAKADWRFGRAFLRTNLAVYHAKYKDIQRILTDPGITPVQAVTTNAGSARINGIEAEILFRPIPAIEFTLDYNHTDAKFTSFITPAGQDLTDTPFARAPRNVYTIGARVRPPIDSASGELSIGGSLYHISDFNGEDAYVPGFTEVQGWTLLNADASWNSVMGSNVDIIATVTNLTGRKYSLLTTNLNGLGFTSHTPGEPRKYTITLRYRFGG